MSNSKSFLEKLFQSISKVFRKKIVQVSEEGFSKVQPPKFPQSLRFPSFRQGSKFPRKKKYYFKLSPSINFCKVTSKFSFVFQPFQRYYNLITLTEFPIPLQVKVILPGLKGWGEVQKKIDLRSQSVFPVKFKVNFLYQKLFQPTKSRSRLDHS